MSAFLTIADSFKNFVAGLNTGRDKQAGGVYSLDHLSDDDWLTIYRVSWMAKKVVDIPAKDATRKWREWQAESDQIELIENEEARLQLPQKVTLAVQQSRLYGGSGIYFSIRGDDPSLPLDPSRVGKGGLDFVTVFPKGVLNPGDIETDPMAVDYGLPQWYEVGGVRVHRSRMAIFTGSTVLDPHGLTGTTQGWGDSVLQAAHEAIRDADAIATNIASLVYEAKVDILQIPNLGDIMHDPNQRKLLEDRVRLSARLKGNNGTLVIDAEEEYSQKQFNFAGLPEVGNRALQAVAGAADIPLTRFLGQSPAGLSSTGESDLKNYYDAISGDQELTITPALSVLDEALIISALGTRPAGITYEWASLWQMSDEQRSKISKETADTIKVLTESGLFPEDALAKAAINLLVEHSILPSFEIDQTANEYEYEGPLADRAVVDGTPKTLYLHRKVLNAGAITAWAKKQGFTQLVSAEELHVTVAYSKTPVDWLALGEDWSSDQEGRLHIKPGGPRGVELFGDDAKVLTFACSDLTWRNEQITEAGASWDHDGYAAHITLTYGEMPEGVEPYQGPIVLGPETFEEIDPNAQENIKEITL